MLVFSALNQGSALNPRAFPGTTVYCFGFKCMYEICPAFAHLYQIVKQKPPVDHLQLKASGRMTEKFFVTQFSGILQWKGVFSGLF